VRVIQTFAASHAVLRLVDPEIGSSNDAEDMPRNDVPLARLTSSEFGLVANDNTEDASVHPRKPYHQWNLGCHK
jgi:hypothetical protein